MKTRLIMTLLVKDEEDIIENNICFHLNKGVDYIMVTDNGSTDGTRDILDKYSKKGVLNYIENLDNTYQQYKWVSNMAKKAVEEFGATHLFHCDADEFWLPKKGKNLKDISSKIENVVSVRLINYLPPENMDMDKFNFNNFSRRINKTILYPEDVKLYDSSKILLYEYPRKIMTTKNYVVIGYGNHCVDSIKPEDMKTVEDIHIHHFSIRSYKHFERKVVNGGKAFKNNPDKSERLGWHWKKWYEIYLSGGLREEYEKITLSGKFDTGIKTTDLVKKVSVPKSIKYAKKIYWFNNILW